MGILFSFLAALFFSLSHITVRKGVTQLGVSSGTIVMLMSGTISTLVIALAMDGVDVLSPLNLASVLFFALGGVIHFLGGWGFQNASASRIGPAHLSAMTGSTPLFATILAFISLHQVINIYILGGIFMIVVGILVITLGEKNEE